MHPPSASARLPRDSTQPAYALILPFFSYPRRHSGCSLTLLVAQSIDRTRCTATPCLGRADAARVHQGQTCRGGWVVFVPPVSSFDSFLPHPSLFFRSYSRPLPCPQFSLFHESLVGQGPAPFWGVGGQGRRSNVLCLRSARRCDEHGVCGRGEEYRVCWAFASSTWYSWRPPGVCTL